MSLKTSLADLPSIVVPLTLKKSSSATPLVNLGTLLLDIPVSRAEAVPSPEILSLASLNTDLSAGYVTNISFVETPQFTALFELLLFKIVVRASVLPLDVYVPIPISKLLPSVQV